MLPTTVATQPRGDINRERERVETKVLLLAGEEDGVEAKRTHGRTR